MRISIGMATFNGGRYILEQLKSFSSQTCLPHELVVCDDGSKDDTVRIVEGFASTSPFEVKIFINETRLGYSRNFERALSIASGDIIFLSDQDDKWYPTKIEDIIDIFALDDEYQVVINDREIVDTDLTPIGTTTLRNIYKSGFGEEQFVAGCSTAMRKSWREFVLPFPDLQIPYDSWINQLAYRLDARFVCKVSLQLYRRHETNTSNSHFSKGKTSVFHPFLGKVLTGKMPHALADTCKILLTYRDRMARGQTYGIKGVTSEQLDAALCQIDREIRFLMKRAEIISLPRYRRVIPIFRSWLRGDYDDVAGALSVVKDMFLKGEVMNINVECKK